MSMMKAVMAALTPRVSADEEKIRTRIGVKKETPPDQLLAPSGGKC